MRKIYVIALAAGLLSTISCGEDVLIKTNKNNITTDSYYTTEDEISKGLTGVYAALQANQLGGREYFFLHDLRSDEMASGGGHLEAPRAQVLTGSHAPGNDILTMVWTGLYRLILRANAVIEYGPLVEGGDANLIARYVGEAKFLRAWAYYQLYGFWGGVPLYTTFSTTIEDAQPRSDVAAVKAQIVADLTDAIAALPASYTGADNGRASKIAAQALLAKLYMFDAQYADAKPLLQAVIDAGGANPLMDEYFDNFTEEAEYNKESIWEVSYTSAGNYNWDADGNDYGPNESWMRSQEYSAIGWRNLIPSDKLLEEFEAGDPRMNYTFYFTGDEYGDPASPKTLTDGDQRGNTSMLDGEELKVSWKKYSVMYKLDPGGFYDKTGINYRMLRYADIFLLMAECENEIGSPALAVEYLNKTRQRPSVDMPLYPTADYPTGTKEEIFRAIQHERMVELAGEEIRNFDIVRWRKAGKFTTDPISYFKAGKYELLPIPLNELDRNPQITTADQNPGY